VEAGLDEDETYEEEEIRYGRARGAAEKLLHL